MNSNTSLESKTDKPLREHFEIETDAGTTLRTFDYIKALEDYIEAQKTDQWISVKDRLPEYMEVVLIAVKELGFCLQAQYGGSDAQFESSGYWYEATHWMPLPSPPNQITNVTPE